MNDTVVNEIICGLGALISDSARGMESERRQPRGDADASDDYINCMKIRIATLRRLREEFENEMSK